MDDTDDSWRGLLMNIFEFVNKNIDSLDYKIHDILMHYFSLKLFSPDVAYGRIYFHSAFIT